MTSPYGFLARARCLLAPPIDAHSGSYSTHRALSLAMDATRTRLRQHPTAHRLLPSNCIGARRGDRWYCGGQERPSIAHGWMGWDGERCGSRGGGVHEQGGGGNMWDIGISGKLRMFSAPPPSVSLLLPVFVSMQATQDACTPATEAPYHTLKGALSVLHRPPTLTHVLHLLVRHSDTIKRRNAKTNAKGLDSGRAAGHYADQGALEAERGGHPARQGDLVITGTAAAAQRVQHTARRPSARPPFAQTPNTISVASPRSSGMGRPRPRRVSAPSRIAMPSPRTPASTGTVLPSRRRDFAGAQFAIDRPSPTGPRSSGDAEPARRSTRTKHKAKWIAALRFLRTRRRWRRWVAAQRRCLLRDGKLARPGVDTCVLHWLGNEQVDRMAGMGALKL
ncbi:hypothetical protein BJ912DRAFT_924987 [Pholiota molesta]|nr:hypothetical protein BJ912DRAFT_924987 [Pholiota molesta]